MWWQGHKVTLVCHFFPSSCHSFSKPSLSFTHKHMVKLTHMLKDVFIYLQVAPERVCVRVHVRVEWKLLLLLSEQFSLLPPCLPAGSTAAWRIRLHLIPRPLKSLWHAPGENKKEEYNARFHDAGSGRRIVVATVQLCFASYFLLNTLLLLITQQIK